MYLLIMPPPIQEDLAGAYHEFPSVPAWNKGVDGAKAPPGKGIDSSFTLAPNSSVSQVALGIAGKGLKLHPSKDEAAKKPSGVTTTRNRTDSDPPSKSKSREIDQPSKKALH